MTKVAIELEIITQVIIKVVLYTNNASGNGTRSKDRCEWQLSYN